MINLFKFLIVTAILVISVIFIGGKFAWGIFLLLFMFILVGLIFGQYFSRNVVLQVWHDKLIYESGDKISFNLVLNNTGIGYAPWVQMDLKLPEKLSGYSEAGKVFFLGPLGKATASYNLLAKFKGVYRFENVKIFFADMFNLFKWTKEFEESFTFTVRPKLKKLIGFNYKVKQPFGKYLSKNASFEDLSNIKDIRKFQIGDSYKKIHWKVSAHKGELFIREAEATGSSELILLLDLYKGSFSEDDIERYQQEEECAECIAAFANKAFQEGVNVKFQYFKDELYTIKLDVERGLDLVLDILSSLEGTTMVPISELVKNEWGKFGDRSEIIIVTNDVSQSFLEDLHLKNSLNNITILSREITNKEKIKTILFGNGVQVKSFKSNEKTVLIGEVKFENE